MRHQSQQTIEEHSSAHLELGNEFVEVGIKRG